MNAAELKEKACRKCGRTKPLSEFYMQAGMADGHINTCKKCKLNRFRERRFSSEHREGILLAQRARSAQRPSDYDAIYYQKNAEKIKDRVRNYRSQYPQKKRAQNRVYEAVKNGRLVRPDCCSECGGSGSIHGHHDDYAKPLDVRWLCPSCHQIWHRKNGEAKNAVRMECE